MICLLREQVEAFKKALKEKDVKIEELLNMSTKERTALLEKYAGKNAKDVNLLFEQKLVLKNKLQGIKNWASKTGEIGRYDPIKKAQTEQALKEFREKQSERMFSPGEEQAFLNDLVDKKIGTHITQKEAKNIFDLTVKADKLFEDYDITTDQWKSEQSMAEYGATKTLRKRYVDNLKSGDFSVKEMFKDYSQEIKQLWKEDEFGAIRKVIGDTASGLTNTMINAVASWDNSWIGRQGAITLIKSPKTWWNMAKKSMSDFYKTLKGSNPEDVLMAETFSDPDYINGNYKKAKLDFGIEEEVPTRILEKIPIAGKIFRASDVSFIDSAIRARRGLFKIQKKIYEKKGIPLTDIILEDMGTVINAITARGKVGKIGSSAPVQLLMWAPRMLKADWDVLTAHTLGFGLKTGFARVQAAKTVANVVIATAAITAIAKAMGADVETNPLSTDFLKIKIGNTRINTPFARGMPQIVTLFARLATWKTKNSSGIIQKLNSGEYGSKTLFDIGIDFLVNKTTPPAGAVISWARNRDFTGKKPTPGSTAFRFMPISVQNFIQLKDDASSEAVFGAFADIFGIGSNTYMRETDWSQSSSKEMEEFKIKAGEKKFKQANDEFNQRVNNLLNSEKYKSMSSEEKQTYLTKQKELIKKSIIK